MRWPVASLVKFSAVLTNLDLSDNQPRSGRWGDGTYDPTSRTSGVRPRRRCSCNKLVRTLRRLYRGREHQSHSARLDKQDSQTVSVDLDNCSIGAEGGKALASARHGGVDLLDLSGNRLCGVWIDGPVVKGRYDPSGIKALKDALSVNSVMTACTLIKNNLNIESATMLAKICTEKHIMLSGMEQDQTEVDFSAQF